jgi:NAD(P)-dependent dehydrogenase (short-subunit alcohol dehydrogenase family)
MLAARGARAVVNDVQSEGAEQVVESIQDAGGVAIADGHDIATEDGARGLVDDAVDRFGGVDAIVNNAGVFPLLPFSEMTYEAFDQTLKVHTYGAYLVARHAWPHLVASGSGRIVNISSIAALWGWTFNLSPYGTAKAALLGLTRQLALEGKQHGIGANSVFPNALTRIDLTGGPMQVRSREYAEWLGLDPSDPERVAEVSTARVAAVVAWLCHPDCTASGEFFNAQAGSVRRVFYGMTRGIRDPELTVETVRDGFDTIMDPKDAEVLPPMIEGGMAP